jgi:enamine deaminase RidA (YjgF/YER057c/UK114 family)
MSTSAEGADAYVPAVQSGNLLFVSGVLATAGHAATAVGHLGRELDVAAGLAVFGPARTSARLVFGIASLPLGSPVELEVIFEVTP